MGIMVVMDSLKKTSIAHAAAQMDQPFSMMSVAHVGDILVSVYICEGVLAWHKHLDVDELFWVYEGRILLESDLGRVHLRPGELAVVPKGVSHRSGATTRSSVLLLRCGAVPQRKNGRRRIYAIPGEAELECINLERLSRTLDAPFRFQTAARIEDTLVEVARGEGTWPVEIPAAHDLLLFVLKGTATVHALKSMLHLHAGDLTVVPQDTIYQLSTTKDTALVQVTRERVRR